MKYKKMIINNKSDENKFIKKINLYKSKLYYFTKFELVNNYDKNNDLDNIIKALNIKKKKERITFVYDNAVSKIDNHCKGKNMCGFKNGKCYTQINNNYINGCCRKCIFQSPNGCTTKNLTCKLYNCSEVRSRNKVIEFNDLIILNTLTKRQQIIIKHDYFSSREEVLKDLYIGILTIFTIRIIIRLLFKQKKDSI